MLSQDKEHSKKINTYISFSPAIYFDDFNPLVYYRIGHLLTKTFIRTMAKHITNALR